MCHHREDRLLSHHDELTLSPSLLLPCGSINRSLAVAFDGRAGVWRETQTLTSADGLVSSQSMVLRPIGDGVCAVKLMTPHFAPSAAGVTAEEAAAAGFEGYEHHDRRRGHVNGHGRHHDDIADAIFGNGGASGGGGARAGRHRDGPAGHSGGVGPTRMRGGSSSGDSGAEDFTASPPAPAPAGAPTASSSAAAAASFGAGIGAAMRDRGFEMTLREVGDDSLVLTAHALPSGRPVLIETITMLHGGGAAAGGGSTSGMHRHRSVQRFDEAGRLQAVYLIAEERVLDTLTGAMMEATPVSFPQRQRHHDEHRQGHGAHHVPAATHGRGRGDHHDDVAAAADRHDGHAPSRHLNQHGHAHGLQPAHAARGGRGGGAAHGTGAPFSTTQSGTAHRGSGTLASETHAAGTRGGRGRGGGPSAHGAAHKPLAAQAQAQTRHGARAGDSVSGGSVPVTAATTIQSDSAPASASTSVSASHRVGAARSPVSLAGASVAESPAVGLDHHDVAAVSGGTTSAGGGGGAGKASAPPGATVAQQLPSAASTQTQAQVQQPKSALSSVTASASSDKGQPGPASPAAGGVAGGPGGAGRGTGGVTHGSAAGTH